MPKEEEHMERLEIAVYCAWRERPSREYRLGEDVGRAIAERGHRLIFGGGDLGTMGKVAAAAKAAGGYVTAVVPEADPSWLCPCDADWDELIVTKTLNERRDIFDRRAQTIVVLPGSIGTLAEMFVSIEYAQGARTMVVVDPWGYYDGLLEWLPNILPPGFMPIRVRSAEAAVAAVEGRVLVR